MRIIAGNARGLRLVSPPGNQVRPTLDRVREALFNIIAPGIIDASFLDLFAGSGANGIEALSRGAASAVFVDSNAQAHTCIRKNLETTRLGQGATLLRYSLPGELAKITGCYDVIFADPPYDFAEFDTLLSAIVEAGLLADGGQVIVEHSSFKTLPDEAATLTCGRRRRYGKCTLSFYT